MPNILTEGERHARYCIYEPSEWAQVGDIRICKHFWRTLHPIWTPIRYWRARKALRDD